MFIKSGEKVSEEKTDGFVKHSKGFIVEVSKEDVLNPTGSISEEKEENNEEKNNEESPESL